MHLQRRHRGSSTLSARRVLFDAKLITCYLCLFQAANMCFFALAIKILKTNRDSKYGHVYPVQRSPLGKSSSAQNVGVWSILSFVSRGSSRSLRAGQHSAAATLMPDTLDEHG